MGRLSPVPPAVRQQLESLTRQSALNTITVPKCSVAINRLASGECCVAAVDSDVQLRCRQPQFCTAGNQTKLRRASGFAKAAFTVDLVLLNCFEQSRTAGSDSKPVRRVITCRSDEVRPVRHVASNSLQVRDSTVCARRPRRRRAYMEGWIYGVEPTLIPPDSRVSVALLFHVTRWVRHPT